MAKIVKHIQRTLLIVGEGPSEAAFLKHMQSIYDSRENGQRITIHASNGKSPENIVNTAIRFRGEFNKKVVLLDSDIALTSNVNQKINSNRIEIILSEPLCLEGMLLSMLKEAIPTNSPQCKKNLHPKLGGSSTKPGSYSALFTRKTLDACEIESISKLKKLLSNINDK